ncbi:hypothetical protein H0A70_14835 [Alcaligenaceae bacterium]|nr:hypothetical protein [Alcaligenaceae bacterium]
MKKWATYLLSAGLVWAAPATARTVQIAAIPNPAHVEVMVVGTEDYLMVAELGEIRFPLQATQQADRTLHFRHQKKQYSISRADVTLMNEKLVNEPCKTVPTTVTANTKMASVKGAGETCK